MTWLEGICVSGMVKMYFLAAEMDEKPSLATSLKNVSYLFLI